MTEKFKNKFRISSARLKTWDYGSNASYFVTICTYNRICYFGRVESGIMHLSDLGNIAQKCWQEIPLHFPFVELSEFVVMPNHVHGIITIMKPHHEFYRINNNRMGDDVVETQNFASLQYIPNRFGPQSKNVGSIIRGYKIGVTKFARITKSDFKWQGRFWDRVIRDGMEYIRIKNYISNNPANWDDDDFFNLTL